MPSTYLLGRVQGATTLVAANAPAHALGELQQQARVQKLPKSAKLVSLVRELALFLFGGSGSGDDDDADAATALPQGFSLELAGALACGALSTLRDSDNDARKAARLLYLLLTEVVARRAPTLIASDGGGWQQINAACAAVLEDASGGHALYAPRRIVALRSLGVLIAAASSGASAPALTQRTHQALRAMVAHAQEELQGAGSKQLKGSRKKEHQDWVGVAEGLASLVRRVVLGTGGAFCPPDWLSFLYLAMLTGESVDASRSALAALAELARRRDDLRTEMAIWLTTNRRLVGSTEGLPDTLQAVYYLRFCAAVAIPASGQLLSASVSEAFVRALLQSVHDKRLRVWLEAVQLLYSTGASAPFSRLMDTAAVGRVLCLALQEQTSAPAVTAILRAVRTVGKWLHEAPAAGHLESIGQQPAAGPLLEAVLAKAAALQPLAAPPSVRLGCLLALVWLAPSPSSTSTGSDGGEVWASLEAQAVSGAAHLTDRQLVEVLTELLGRFTAAATAGPAKAMLARTLLELVRTLLGGLPSDQMARAALRVYEALWAAAMGAVIAAAARDEQGAPIPFLLSSSTLGESRPGIALAREVIGSMLAVLDDAMTTTGSVGGGVKEGPRPVPRRYPRVWQAQGCTGPLAPAEARAVRVRFLRLALESLGRWGAQLAPSEDGLAAVVLVRLQAAALHGDAQTRAAALAALCSLAVGTASLEVRMAAYQFLSQQQLHAAKGESGGSSAKGTDRQQREAELRTALACFDAASGSVVDGVVVATIAHLEDALLLEQGAGGIERVPVRLLRVE